MKIRWTPGALADGLEIKKYIGRDSDKYATAVLARIVELIESIPKQPYSGRVVPELDNPTVRERFHRDYRIIYRLREDTVEILAIRHSSRELKQILV